MIVVANMIGWLAVGAVAKEFSIYWAISSRLVRTGGFRNSTGSTIEHSAKGRHHDLEENKPVWLVRKRKPLSPTLGEWAG